MDFKSSIWSGLAAICLWCLSRAVSKWRRTVALVGWLFSSILPRIRGLTVGNSGAFVRKYSKFGWDVITSVSMFPPGKDVIVSIADATVAKEILTARTRFPKPLEMYGVLSFFGPNVVVSEGDDWRRYRKLTSPSFSDENNKLVWNESIKIVTDLFENVWGQQEAIHLEHPLDITLPIALYVISVAGFGRRISWVEDQVVPAGHQLTFKDALETVSHNTFVKFLLPDLILRTTKRFRKARLAFSEIEKYMIEMIENRKAGRDNGEEQYDLFTSLVDAGDSEKHLEVSLTDKEVMGNVFIFLLAGHETTAQTLCFSLLLLALYQAEQDLLYEEVKSVYADGKTSTYAEMSELPRTMAVLYEALRMFPPAKDSTFVTENTWGERKAVHVPSGSSLSINIVGMHYNPRYWKDPDEFNPSRFLGDWPRDAFLPFFETEGVAILSMLVSQYRIELKDDTEPYSPEKKARVLAARRGLTLSAVGVPLTLRRRDAR
ncbi:cytochrome P450 [Marasmius fiardii PR-910]|nr:cytochrome P450 [Marasmius fiardii PR-910]